MRELLKGIRAVFLGLDPCLMKWYYRYFYTPKNNTLAYTIDQHLKQKSIFHFLQIGGNDGFSHDPLFKFVKRYPSKGIIVEPQKRVFERRLKWTYLFEDNVILQNIAIAHRVGTRKLYKIAISESRWATGLASFEREVLIEQIRKNDRLKRKAKREGLQIPKSEDEWISYEEVHCQTIHHIADSHGFVKLDLLLIDTEGYDFEIIKTINFKSLPIAMICYEHANLSQKDKRDCEKLLLSHQYELTSIGGDTIAIAGALDTF